MVDSVTIRRRGFVAGLATLPLIGWMAFRSQDAQVAAAATSVEVAHGPAELVLARLDHCSSWAEAAGSANTSKKSWLQFLNMTPAALGFLQVASPARPR